MIRTVTIVSLSAGTLGEPFVRHELELGLNVVQGKVVYKPVAEAWGLPYEPLEL